MDEVDKGRRSASPLVDTTTTSMGAAITIRQPFVSRNMHVDKVEYICNSIYDKVFFAKFFIIEAIDDLMLVLIQSNNLVATERSKQGAASGRSKQGAASGRSKQGAASRRGGRSNKKKLQKGGFKKIDSFEDILGSENSILTEASFFTSFETNMQTNFASDDFFTDFQQAKDLVIKDHINILDTLKDFLDEIRNEYGIQSLKPPSPYKTLFPDFTDPKVGIGNIFERELRKLLKEHKDQFMSPSKIAEILKLYNNIRCASSTSSLKSGAKLEDEINKLKDLIKELFNGDDMYFHNVIVDTKAGHTFLEILLRLAMAELVHTLATALDGAPSWGGPGASSSKTPCKDENPKVNSDILSVQLSNVKNYAEKSSGTQTTQPAHLARTILKKLDGNGDNIVNVVGGGGTPPPTASTPQAAASTPQAAASTPQAAASTQSGIFIRYANNLIATMKELYPELKDVTITILSFTYGSPGTSGTAGIPASVTFKIQCGSGTEDTLTFEEFFNVSNIGLQISIEQREHKDAKGAVVSLDYLPNKLYNVLNQDSKKFASFLKFIKFFQDFFTAAIAKIIKKNGEANSNCLTSSVDKTVIIYLMSLYNASFIYSSQKEYLKLLSTDDSADDKSKKKTKKEIDKGEDTILYLSGITSPFLDKTFKDML